MKQRRKYAAIGEFVKIVTPKEFVRCGYPLTIKLVMEQQFEEIEKDCARMFAALEHRPVPLETVPPPEDKLNFGFSVLAVKESSNMSATVHGMLCAAIAAYRLEQQNYGGNTRVIVERDGPFEVGQRVLVTGKRCIKTGKRFPSRGYRSSYDGEYDLESGGLDDVQTHCVYSFTFGMCNFKILAAHCELISS